MVYPVGLPAAVWFGLGVNVPQDNYCHRRPK